MKVQLYNFTVLGTQLNTFIQSQDEVRWAIFHTMTLLQQSFHILGIGFGLTFHNNFEYRVFDSVKSI